MNITMTGPELMIRIMNISYKLWTASIVHLQFGI